MQLDLVSKGQDFLIYLPFFAFGMAFRAYRGGDSCALIGLSFAVLASIYNAAENASGLSMTHSIENIFGYVICYVIFVATMVTFKKGVVPAVNYLGILSYPLYLVHQDLGLIGIELLKPEIVHLVAALLVVVLAVALAAVVQFITVWLTAVLRRDWSFKAVR